LAVVDGERSLDYAALDCAARAVAARLVARGVGRGSVVALAVDRSAEIIAALDAVQAASEALVRNGNEEILLADLLLRLPPVVPSR
ncbi:MAG: AMP-binding protein, partial [Actinomycetota bacterium]